MHDLNIQADSAATSGPASPTITGTCTCSQASWASGKMVVSGYPSIIFNNSSVINKCSSEPVGINAANKTAPCVSHAVTDDALARSD